GSCVTALCTLSISSLLNDSGCALSSSAIRSRFASNRARALMAGLGLLVAILIPSKRCDRRAVAAGGRGPTGSGWRTDRPLSRASSLRFVPAGVKMPRICSVKNNFRLVFQHYDATIRHSRDRVPRLLMDDDATVARWVW